MSAGIRPCGEGRRIGYARVSTDTQTLYQYTDALMAAGCAEADIFYDDATSAVAEKRCGLQRARACLGPGDTFVVLSIDRAFRSTIEGLLFLDGLHREGIEFVSIYQNVDTHTPEGRKWFTYAVADAEYERAVISRRTKDKMAAARRRGRHMGRPFKLKRRRVMRAWHLVRDKGMEIDEIAALWEVAPVTVTRAFKRYGLEAGLQ